MKMSAIIVLLAAFVLAASAMKLDPSTDIESRIQQHQKYQDEANALNLQENRECLFNFNFRKLQFKTFGETEISKIDAEIPVWEKTMSRLNQLVIRNKRLVAQTRNVTLVDVTRKSIKLMQLDWKEFNSKIRRATEKKSLIVKELESQSKSSAQKYCNLPVILRNKVEALRAQVNLLEVRASDIAKKIDEYKVVDVQANNELSSLGSFRARMLQIKQESGSAEDQADADRKIGNYKLAESRLRLTININKANIKSAESKLAAIKFIKDALAVSLSQFVKHSLMNQAEYLIDGFVTYVHQLSTQYDYESDNLAQAEIGVEQADFDVVNTHNMLDDVEANIEDQNRIKRLANRELGLAQNAGETMLAQQKFDKSASQLAALHERARALKDGLKVSYDNLRDARKRYETAISRENDVSLKLQSIKTQESNVNKAIQALYNAPKFDTTNPIYETTQKVDHPDLVDTPQATKQFTNEAVAFIEVSEYIDHDTESETAVVDKMMSAEAEATGAGLYDSSAVNDAVKQMLDTKAVPKKLDSRHAYAEDANPRNKLYKAVVEDPAVNKFKIPTFVISPSTFSSPWYRDQLDQVAV